MHRGNRTLVSQLQNFYLWTPKEVVPVYVANKWSDLLSSGISGALLSSWVERTKLLRVWDSVQCFCCAPPPSPFPTLPTLCIGAGENIRKLLSGSALRSCSCWPFLMLGNASIQLYLTLPRSDFQMFGGGPVFWKARHQCGPETEGASGKSKSGCV